MWKSQPTSDNSAVPPYTPYQDHQPWYLAPQYQALLFPHPPLHMYHLLNGNVSNEPPVVQEVGSSSQARQEEPPPLIGFSTTEEVENQQTTTEKSSKRTRSSFDTDQILELEREFQSNAYPSWEKRAQIAKKLELGERTVKTWFQNRRVKQKKHEEAKTMECCSRVNYFCKRNNSTTNEVRRPCSTNEGKATDVVGDCSSFVNEL